VERQLYRVNDDTACGGLPSLWLRDQWGHGMTKLKLPVVTGDLASSLRILAQVGSRSRRRNAQLLLAMGIVTTAASLGILAGQILRATSGL